MKTIKLNLGQIAQIHSEILGNPNAGLKGLINYELKINLKFKLHTLAKNLEQHAEFFKEENSRLVSVYGAADSNGTISIDPKSEKFAKFIEEMNAVASIEHDIKVLEMSIDEFETIQTTDYPAYLFGLITEMSEL